MKPTIILLAPPTLGSFWLKSVTSGEGALLSKDLVFCAEYAADAAPAIDGDGAGQLLVIPLGSFVEASIRAAREQRPGLAVALVEKFTGEKVKREVSFDAPPNVPKPHRGPGVIRSVTIPGLVPEDEDWTGQLRGLCEYTVVHDRSSGTGTSFYRTVERFLASLSAPTSAEMRARRLWAANLAYAGQVPS